MKQPELTLASEGSLSNWIIISSQAGHEESLGDTMASLEGQVLSQGVS